MTSVLRTITGALVALLYLSACGSSSDSQGAATYAIGGTVVGLTGSGLTLATPGQESLRLSPGQTSFIFGTRVPSGTTFTVTVTTQPTSPPQTCVVTNGTGTILAADVTNVAVSCSNSQFAIGGTVSGLQGQGLVLATAGQANLAVTAPASTFTFGARVDSGTAYAVTVASQPVNPSQTCVVANGSGTVGSSDVSSVAVTCTTNNYALGGTLNGYAGTGLQLRYASAVPPITVPAGTTSFTFGSVPSGTAYAVAVVTQPTNPTQNCSVGGGTGTVANADVGTIVVNCATNAFLVSGSVTGLTGSGLVLEMVGVQEVSVLAGATSFAFGSPVASGTVYNVRVKTQPANPAQNCTVTNGTGLVSGNVTNVAVACTTSSFALGGSVSGLAGSGLVLQSTGLPDVTVTSGATGFSFGSVPSGTPYAITVKTQPSSPTQTCSVTNGNGTVTGGAVSNVSVACITNLYPLGGTVTGYAGTGLQVRYANGVTPITVPAGSTAFLFGSLPSGTAYSVTVAAQPALPTQNCTVANGTGTIGSAAVNNVSLTCVTPTIMQSWSAPATWGGTSTFWSDGEPGMVEHGVATASGFQERTLPGAWAAWGSIGNVQFDGFGPGLTRYGAGPFLANASAPPLRYQITGGDDGLNLTGDMLVCAVIQPDWNPVQDGKERVIMAKGKQYADGWVLMQMHESYCFHYQGQDTPGGSGWRMNWTFTDFPNNLAPRGGPNDVSLVVVCGGRSGDEIVVLANNYWDTVFNGNGVPTTLQPGEPMKVTTKRATVGGYTDSDPDHLFAGIIYETAVWALPATAANVEAKMAAVLGMRDSAGMPLRYERNRDAPYQANGAWYTQARHGPRWDPANGLLFGLQGTNRIPYPENFDLWTVTGAVTVIANQAAAPYGTRANFGTNASPPADEINFTGAGTLSVLMSPFAVAGSTQGQVWLYPLGAGSIEISSVYQPGTTSEQVLGTQAVTFGGLAGQVPLNQWSRVYLNQLSSLGLPATTKAETFTISRASGAPHFYAWGAALTQLDGSNGTPMPAGFDPGPTMYSNFIESNGEELLELPAVVDGTAMSGFCLAVQLQPPAGMPWDTAAFAGRGLISWHNPGLTAAAELSYTGSSLVFRLLNGGPSSTVTVTNPAWNPAPGSLHTVKACVTPTNTVEIYGDDVLIGSGTGSVPPMIDLAGGSVQVGNAWRGHWQGYVRSAAVCRYPGGTNIADCH